MLYCGLLETKFKRENTNEHKKSWYLLIITLLAITLVIPTNLVLAESPQEMVDVLVTFYQPPGSGEIGLIESLGGSVKKVYHIVPTIAATIPSENLDELRADPRVKWVEPDITFTGSFAGEVLPWGVDRVDAELVHPSNKGTGVKVAILDSGIDLDHPDLAVSGNVTFVAGTTNGDDDNGHGTLVAGIVAALDNDIGVIGVAPEASLYAVKVLNQDGAGVMSVILSGIEWAWGNNMQVMNMSFGSSSINWPSTIKEALDNAYNGGMVIVAGAGNGGNAAGEGNNVWTPAWYKSVIAVGASDNQDARYTSSSTGYTLELMAPGVNIYSTTMGDSYSYITGTSASSPHAAGVAALLIASGLTNNIAVRHRLRDSAEDLGTVGWDSQFGKGMVNANRAITFSEPPDQSAPTSTISLNGTLGNYGWYGSNVQVTLTAADNTGGSGVAITKYSLDGGGTWQVYTSPFIISSEGSNLVLARSWDNAGNDEGPPAFETIKIDQTPPNPTTIVVRSGTMGNNGWYVSNVVVDMWTTDNPGGSGIAKNEYSQNGGESWQTYTPFLTITTDGNHTILARAWDNAGNVNEPPSSLTFKIDQTAPVTTISLNGTIGNNDWYLSDVAVTLAATDNISGMTTIEYSLNGGGNWQTYSVPFTISSEGTNPILARAQDNAGNVGSPPASRDVKVDKTAPVTTTSLNGTMGNNNWYLSNVSVSLDGADNASGVATIEYSLNGGGSWLTYSAPFTISNEGTNPILARTRDNAGNLEAPPVSRDVKVDKTAPVLTETAIPSQIARQRRGVMVNVSYNGTAQDLVSGLFGVNTVLIDEYGVYGQNFGSSLSGTVSVEAWSNGNDPNGRTYTFRLTASDLAGNQASIDAIVLVPHP